MIAVTAVMRYGVPNVGWTLARPTGSSPSRAIAKATRVWPIIRISTTTVSPMVAPMAIRSDIQCNPTFSNAVARGAASSGSMSR